MVFPQSNLDLQRASLVFDVFATVIETATHRFHSASELRGFKFVVQLVADGHRSVTGLVLLFVFLYC